MRIFVFILLVSVASAAPQGGYNYQIQIDSSIANDLSQEQYQLLQKYAQQQLNEQHQVQQKSQHQVLEPRAQQQAVLQSNPKPFVQKTEPAAVVENVQQPSAIPQKQKKPQLQSQPIAQQRYQPTQQRHQATQYNKEFFYLSAPQEDFELPQDIDNHIENLRKNIRVLFIRAPEQNRLANDAVQLAKQSIDQQTVVYVLTKQHDSADLAQKFQQVHNNVQSKPDVIFVKYKTPEEAEHAQRTIQSQYEALDGSNHFHHQGVVSTHNFVGSTGNHHTNSVHIDPRKSSTSDEAETPSSSYLPAAKKL